MYYDSRIRLKRIANKVGVPTNGKRHGRNVPKPINNLRADLYVRCLGDGWGNLDVSPRAIKGFDDLLEIHARAYSGELGPALELAQRYLAMGRNALFEANRINALVRRTKAHKARLTDCQIMAYLAFSEVAAWQERIAFNKGLADTAALAKVKELTAQQAKLRAGELTELELTARGLPLATINE